MCIPKHRATFHAFREDVAKLSEMRDDFAHNVFGVSGHPGSDRFRIGATRWPKPDWRMRFDLWAAKWAGKPIRLRPDAPRGATAHIYYWEGETAELLSAVNHAREVIHAIALAVGRGEQFEPPSTSIIPEALGHLTPRIQ